MVASLKPPARALYPHPLTRTHTPFSQPTPHKP